ncbi:lysophospholipase [Schizosaccharomyces japonicus yFS275]|uniref:Lysophospholipase n=1 Tax=Schizosaccharomyces japonicus (strain yFS275 / FY16936) TaxID=402676 RepID=B6JZP9_SCHJY|nr:lysophospholipase [Schizosaccharomyces japonicus yFS275]EEB07017.1 lysophospholipase [Schizosaccharomyces japonicus yFS275]
MFFSTSFAQKVAAALAGVTLTTHLVGGVSAVPIDVLNEEVYEGFEIERDSELITSLTKRHTDASYAPRFVDCPSDYMLRDATLGVSDGEKAFLDKRTPVINEAMNTFLKRANLKDLNISEVITDEDGPRLGIAFSGGGFRAMINGAGVVKAMDSRYGSNYTSVSGLLQSAMYVTGLSGGSWLVGSISINNFSNITFLKDNVWDLSDGIFFPKSNFVKDLIYYHDLKHEIDEKADAGFNTSITDVWGRALSRHLIDAERGGPNITFSSIRNQSWFQNGEFPYPIIVADSRYPDEKLVAMNSTIYEFSPYEFGSWDNAIKSFLPMEYLGTALHNGSKTSSRCVRQFDNAGFVMGTSSTLFNAALLRYEGSNSTISNLFKDFLEDLSEHYDDIAAYPNPYQYYKSNHSNATNYFYDTKYLNLVDGGEDNQNIPIWPLLHPQRYVDTVFAVDSSANKPYAWPNGSSLVNTYKRMVETPSQRNFDVRGFPYIPDEATFVSLGLNSRPTFFGCDGRNTTLNSSVVNNKTPPLVVYLPNAPWTFDSNISTFDLSIDDDDVDDIIKNSVINVSQNNSETFTTCIACALIQRSLERKNMSTTSQCKQCFSDYCWNGTVVSSKDTTIVYNPTLRANAVTSTASTTVFSAQVMYAAMAIVASIISTIF